MKSVLRRKNVFKFIEDGMGRGKSERERVKGNMGPNNM